MPSRLILGRSNEHRPARRRARRLRIESLETRWALAAHAAVDYSGDDHHADDDHPDHSASADSAGSHSPGATCAACQPTIRLAAMRASAPAQASKLAPVSSVASLPVGLRSTRKPIAAPAGAPPVSGAAAGRGDFNNDGVVSGADVAVMAGNLGRTVGVAFAHGDLNGDNQVGLADLAGIVPGPIPCAQDSGFPAGWIVLGEACFHPIDHASFVLRWNGVTIYNDPVGNASLYSAFPRADVILVSHGHGDHFSATTINAVADNVTTDGDGTVQIITSQAVYNQSSFASLRSAATVLGYGQSIDVRGLSVAAVHAYNTNHALGSGNGYVVTYNGYRMYISGDTGAQPEIRALDDIDAAVVCMNVPFTMTVDEAASVVRDIQPSVAIPYHYRNSGGTFADLNRFQSLVGSDLGIQVRLLDWY